VKLLLDANLSPQLVEALADIYPHAEHVDRLGLGAADDSNIWNYALSGGFAIVSKDSDFWDRSVIAKVSPKIIWIRLGNCSTRDVEHVLRSRYESIRGFLEESHETCLVVARR
jgi:predicted nuclease of predicted toxin-antitoxin system